MTARRKLSTLLFAAASLAAPGFADIPPPGGYEEPCTVAKRCAPEEEGTSCGTYFREPRGWGDIVRREKALRSEYVAKAVALPDDGQRAAWKALIGEPFDP